jgi:hypothetical protein
VAVELPEPLAKPNCGGPDCSVMLDVALSPPMGAVLLATSESGAPERLRVTEVALTAAL